MQIKALRWNASARTISWALKPVVHVLALLPAAYLIYGLFNNQLGANPIEKLLDETGIWCIRFIMITLAISPLRSITTNVWLTQFRRMLGLYAFFYGLCHFLIYFILDQSISLAFVIEDIVQRPFITVGFAALCILLTLAITSSNFMRRKLKRNWNRLHQTVYVCGILVLLHYLWLTRADYREPALYVIIFSVLMAFRVVPYLKAKVLVKQA